MIDDRVYEAGGELLAHLDAMGFGATTAGWLYRRETRDWQMFLVTKLVAEKGPRWVYQRLLRALRSLSDPVLIPPMRVSAMEISEPFLGDLRLKVDVDARHETLGKLPARMILEPASIDGVRVRERAVLYRLDTTVPASARRFDTSVRKLAA